ncbi:MAG: hypothetical protein RLZZ72_751, partial [Actinomycetota bacterium]
AGVAKLADAPDLGSGAERRGGSSPFTRTKKNPPREISGDFSFALVLRYANRVAVVVDLKTVWTAVQHLDSVATLRVDAQL